MHHRQGGPYQPRHAAILIETIVALPVLLIGLLAIVEFGMLSSAQVYLQMAARAGADAAVYETLPSTGTPPAAIIEAVNAALECRGIEADGIRVEHAREGVGPFVLEYGAPCTALFMAPTVPGYVRVSVCVSNANLAPNLLQRYCLDLNDNRSQKSVTRCYP